jgi:hypothetical protein
MEGEGEGGFMLDAKFRECSILMRPPAAFREN